jgi:beta-glucanase (GH16 family)
MTTWFVWLIIRLLRIHDSGGRNKFCFTGGYIEAAVQLPGPNNVIGMWPAIWTMGNLGRAGYGASLEGLVRLFNPDEAIFTLTWASV